MSVFVGITIKFVEKIVVFMEMIASDKNHVLHAALTPAPLPPAVEEFILLM